MNNFRRTFVFKIHGKGITLQTVMGLSYLHDQGVVLYMVVWIFSQYLRYQATLTPFRFSLRKFWSQCTSLAEESVRGFNNGLLR